jgi:preprotein translocase subunit SecA
MGTFKIPEDEPIFNSMITRSLEKAQTKIEELNFDSRKHVLAYDDVLNVQRQSVYARRRALLTGDDEAIEAELNRLAELHPELAVQIATKKDEFGNMFHSNIRRFFLQIIDSLWVDHLEAMEYLRSSVNLRAYGQRDPLVEYKKEGLRMFQNMEETYTVRAIEVLTKMNKGGGFVDESAREAQAIENAAIAITAGRGAAAPQFGRNDVVQITNGTETKEMKYKKAEPLIEGGEWRIVDAQMETGKG